MTTKKVPVNAKTGGATPSSTVTTLMAPVTVEILPTDRTLLQRTAAVLFVSEAELGATLIRAGLARLHEMAPTQPTTPEEKLQAVEGLLSQAENLVMDGFTQALDGESLASVMRQATHRKEGVARRASWMKPLGVKKVPKPRSKKKVAKHPGIVSTVDFAKRRPASKPKPSPVRSFVIDEGGGLYRPPTPSEVVLVNEKLPLWIGKTTKGRVATVMGLTHRSLNRRLASKRFTPHMLDIIQRVMA